MIKEKIFGFLGPYDKLIDSNKNNAGKGTLERYMEAYGDDVDVNLLPLVENLVQNLFDPERLFARYLDYHEETLGVLPLDFTRNDTNTQAANEWMRRRLLRHIGRLQAIKGTRRVYDILIKLVEPTVSSITIQEFTFENRYDTAIRYDDGLRYDTSICSECPQYAIDIVTTPTGTASAAFIKALKSIILFNHPIDCKVKEVKYNGVVVGL